MWQKGTAQRCARAAWQAFNKRASKSGGSTAAGGGSKPSPPSGTAHSHHHHQRGGGGGAAGAGAPHRASAAQQSASRTPVQPARQSASHANFGGASAPAMSFAANAFARGSGCGLGRATQVQAAWASLRASGPTFAAPQPASASDMGGKQPMGTQARSCSSVTAAAEGDDETSSCNSRSSSGLLSEANDDEEDPGTSHASRPFALLPNAYIPLRHHGPHQCVHHRRQQQQQQQQLILLRRASSSAGGDAGRGGGRWDSPPASSRSGQQQQQQQRQPQGFQQRPPVGSPSALAARAGDPSSPLHLQQQQQPTGPSSSGGVQGAGGGYAAPGGLQPAGGVAPASQLEDECLEMRVFAKDAFFSKQLPVPQGVREVLYAHRWDKLLVDVRRSVHLVAGQGKVDEYTAMVAVGNMKGLFGLGLADAPTAQEAVAAAHLRAYGNLTVVPLYRNHTIFHRIEHEYHFLKVIMQPRHSGAGIVASDLMTELCNLVGIRDINIKVHARRRSRMFVATAFQEALLKQAVPHDGVEGSGIYLREVFHKPKLPGLLRGSSSQTNGSSS